MDGRVFLEVLGEMGVSWTRATAADEREAMGADHLLARDYGLRLTWGEPYTAQLEVVPPSFGELRLQRSIWLALRGVEIPGSTFGDPGFLRHVWRVLRAGRGG